MWWTKFMKTVGTIFFIVGIIGSLIAAINFSTYTGRDSWGHQQSQFNFGMFLLTFVVGSLITAISVGMLMVVVEISENILKCRILLDKDSLFTELDSSNDKRAEPIYPSSANDKQAKRVACKCDLYFDPKTSTCLNCGSKY